MKKLIFSSLAAVGLVCFAADYSSEFNAAVTGGRLEVADSLLRLWEASAPADPELYPARFNLLFNQAQNSVIELSDDTSPDGVAIVLADTLGNAVGSLAERIERNDSIFKLAIAEIDRGIAALPGRLDFRLGKAAAAGYFRKWDMLASTLEGVLDSADRDWFWTGGAALGDSARSVISAASFDYVRDIYMDGGEASVTVAASLGDRALVCFPENVELLNLMGGIAFDRGDAASALGYMGRALELRPCDGLVRYNMAYVYFTEGDSTASLEVCREIAASDCVDSQSKEMAAGLERRIQTPLESMRAYDYFFRWLPAVAAQALEIGDIAWLFGTPGPVNDEIAAANGFRSPFAASDISVSRLDAGGRDVFVWTFPMPGEMPLCRYVAFVADAKGVRCFMLEKSFENYWVIGSMEEGTHVNYGGVDSMPEDANAFVGIILQWVLSAEKSSD